MSRYLIFTVCSLSFLLVAISGTSVSVAFPDITASFNASLILAGWVLSVNQLAPAANNACIELMPNRVATITGVRGMFRQSGSALNIAITSLILQNFSEIGVGFSTVFYGLAAVLVLSVPFIFAMPRGFVTLPSTKETEK